MLIKRIMLFYHYNNTFYYTSHNKLPIFTLSIIHLYLHLRKNCILKLIYIITKY